MKRHLRTVSVVVVVVVMALTLGSWVVAQGSDDQPGSTQAGASLAGSDDQPIGPPEVIIPERYQPKAGAVAAPVPPVPTTPVYFTPQDGTGNATVLFLYNTSDTSANVRLRSYTLAGAQNVDTTVTVPAGELVRICSDAVTSTQSSWQDVVIVNFTTLSAYARMLLPEGVKAEAYVVWNGSADYDPNDALPTLNIRFSTDPESVYLPAIHSD